MICGGTVKVAVCPLAPADAGTVRSVLDHLDRRTSALLSLSPAGLSVHAGGGGTRHPVFTESANGVWRYEEPLLTSDTVYIVGGGHVGLALSRLLDTLDLRIVVLDPRDELNTLVENPFADETVIVPFSRAAEAIPEGDHVYVVIMTPGHRSDEAVLRGRLRKRQRYLGMLGSRHKVGELRERLRAGGFSDDELDRVRAPVGLRIASHTPAEIAVSIAAEIIAVRNAPGRFGTRGSDRPGSPGAAPPP
jgi:xanthine dehydrogenase accessory factor